VPIELEVPPNHRMQARAGGALTHDNERRRTPAAPDAERWPRWKPSCLLT